MRSDTIRRIASWVKLLLILATVAYLAHCLYGYLSRGKQPSPEPTVKTITVYDTIPYYYPVARDSVVVRYETHRLQVSGDKSPGTEQGQEEMPDSADVVIPLTQKEYQDSTYHAWISGYAVNLDSIHTFTRHDYTTVTLPPAKPKRWHFGISAGVAVTPKGVQPYIGAGITYSFKSF